MGILIDVLIDPVNVRAKFEDPSVPEIIAIAVWVGVAKRRP